MNWLSCDSVDHTSPVRDDSSSPNLKTAWNPTRRATAQPVRRKLLRWDLNRAVIQVMTSNQGFKKNIRLSMQFVLWFCVSSGWFSVISMWLLGDSVILAWFLCDAMWFCLILCVLVWCEFVWWCMIFCDFSVMLCDLLCDSARLYLDFVWFLCGVICVIVYACLWFWCDALWFLCDFAWLLFCVILCLRLAVLRHSWRQIAKAAKELLHFGISDPPSFRQLNEDVPRFQLTNSKF